MPIFFGIASVFIIIHNAQDIIITLTIQLKKQFRAQNTDKTIHYESRIMNYELISLFLQ